MSSSSPSHHIVVLGDSCVGKGSICHRLLYDAFKEKSDVLAQEATYEVPISRILGQNEARWKQTLKIDKMGADPSLADLEKPADFWASLDAAVVVVSLNREAVADSVGKWKEYLSRVRGRPEEAIPVVVVATNADLPSSTEKEAAASSAREAAAANRWSYYEVSCKTGEGVFEVFEELILALEPERRFQDDWVPHTKPLANVLAQRHRSNARLPILVSSSSPETGLFTPDGTIQPLRSTVTQAHLCIGPLRFPEGKQDITNSQGSDSLSDHSDSSSPRQLSPRSDHSDDSYLSLQRKVISGSTDGPGDRTNRRALFTRSVTLTPGLKGSSLSRSDARRSLMLQNQVSRGISATLYPDSLSPSAKSKAKPGSSPLRSSERPQKTTPKYDVSTLRLTDRPTKVPTKIDFQKEANFDGKRRLLIISTDHLFIYKQVDGHKKLVETLEISNASTKRPKATEFKISLLLSSGATRRVKFSDEGTLVLFRGKIQQHSQAKPPVQAPLITPKPPTVFVDGTDALALFHTNEDNHYCADCGAMDPTFVSTNFTVLICGDCAKWHQQLSTAVSRVLSIKQEKWNPYLLEMLMWMSNLVANMIWEERLRNNEEECQMAGLPTKPTDFSNEAEKRAFIEAKYDKRAFLEPNYLASMLNMDDDLPNRALNVALKIATLTPKHFPALVKFISHQISPDTVVDSQPLLLTACASGNCIAAIYLLENGADPNLKDALGTRPIDHSERFDAEVASTLHSEFKTSIQILKKAESGLPDESDITVTEWPSAASTILENYGADSKTSIVPPLLVKKSETGEWGSLRASANSIKAAQLLGLMEAPNRSSTTGSARGSGADLASSLSPRSTMFGVSSHSSPYGAASTSSNSPSPRSPHSSSIMPNSRVSKPTSPTSSSPTSPGLTRNTANQLSDDYRQSHQLNHPPSPKSTEPSVWASASPPQPLSPLQSGQAPLSETARHRVQLASSTWKTTKQGLGKGIPRDPSGNPGLISSATAPFGSSSNPNSDDSQNPMLESSELDVPSGFIDSLRSLSDPTLTPFDDVPSQKSLSNSSINEHSGDSESSQDIPKLDEMLPSKHSWETIQSAPASSNPLQQSTHGY